MSVYVDELRPTPRGAPRWPYEFYCHLFGDTPADLHEFAKRLGLRREWYQSGGSRDPRHYHYDITANKRRQAVQMGAIEVKAREFLRLRRMRAAQARGE